MLVLAVSGSEEVSSNSFPYNYPGPCPSDLAWTPSEGATVDTRAFIVGAGPIENLLVRHRRYSPHDQRQRVG